MSHLVITFIILILVGAATASTGGTNVRALYKATSKGENNQLNELPGFHHLEDAKRKFIKLRAKMGFKNGLQSALTVGIVLDFFNGATWLLVPGVARLAAGGLPHVPGSISSLMGTAFLSAGLGKAQALSDASIDYQKEACKNQLLPLGALAAYLAAKPFSPTTVQPLVAFKAVAAPLLATSGLAYANVKACEYEPPRK